MSTPILTQDLSAKIQLWQATKDQADMLAEQEMKLRKELFAEVFPEPKEGVNHFELGNGYKLDGDYKINRNMDEAALPAVLAELRARQVNTDTLVKYKPSLSISAYKALPDDMRLLFDQCLEIKPGSPSLKIVAPKAKK